MNRPSLSALALALAAACSPQAEQTCPGRTVGSFAFEGTLVTTTTPLAPGLDPDAALTTCGAPLVYPATIAPFTATIAADPASTSGALCRSSGLVLFGTYLGLRWQVETSSDGAVLAGCGPTCTATMREVITGDVFPDTASPTEFRGALVEQLGHADGDCSGCVLPCAARYDLHGTATATP